MNTIMKYLSAQTDFFQTHKVLLRADENMKMEIRTATSTQMIVKEVSKQKASHVYHNQNTEKIITSLKNQVSNMIIQVEFEVYLDKFCRKKKSKSPEANEAPTMNISLHICSNFMHTTYSVTVIPFPQRSSTPPSICSTISFCLSQLICYFFPFIELIPSPTTFFNFHSHIDSLF